MILCLDVGNTHIFGGVFVEQELKVQFRFPSTSAFTSDQIGIFIKAVIRENGIDPNVITKVAICSVVPVLHYTIRSAFIKYFALEPYFLEVKSSEKLTIYYKNPNEVGADRLCNAIAGMEKFPQQDLIIIDLGTATTFDIVTAAKEYLGGVIMPGVQIGMKSLSENTAKLGQVKIIKPDSIIGQSTTTNIQAGLYYSHLGAAREIINQIKLAAFPNTTPIIIGTGGLAYMFEQENIFTTIIPELVLDGLYYAIEHQIENFVQRPKDD
jgi:type III pantothenate kinase